MAQSALRVFEIDALVKEVELKIIADRKVNPIATDKFESDLIKELKDKCKEHDELDKATDKAYSEMIALEEKLEDHLSKTGRSVQLNEHTTPTTIKINDNSLHGIGYDAKQSIRHAIIINNMKNESVDDLINKLVKEFK